MHDLDWNLLRTFVAVAEAGSLGEAARRVGASQPTLGRHVRALEERVGAALFARHARGLRLTDRGRHLYEAAAGVRDGVDHFARRADGLERAVRGSVRVSAARVVAHWALPPIVARLAARHPELAVEIVAEDRTASLSRRDADLAVRMFRPTHPDLIARRIAEAPLGLYASADYLARRGAPDSLDELGTPDHDVVGYDRDGLAIAALRALGHDATRSDFRVRTDDQPLHAHLAAAGAGVAALQRAVARSIPGLTRVLCDLELPTLPVWLVAHPELHDGARYRTTFDALAEGLADFYRA